MYWTDLLNKSY